jgi:hypothetical protein
MNIFNFWRSWRTALIIACIFGVIIYFHTDLGSVERHTASSCECKRISSLIWSHRSRFIDKERGVDELDGSKRGVDILLNGGITRFDVDVNLLSSNSTEDSIVNQLKSSFFIAHPSLLQDKNNLMKLRPVSEFLSQVNSYMKINSNQDNKLNSKAVITMEPKFHVSRLSPFVSELCSISYGYVKMALIVKDTDEVKEMLRMLSKAKLNDCRNDIGMALAYRSLNIKNNFFEWRKHDSYVKEYGDRLWVFHMPDKHLLTVKSETETADLTNQANDCYLSENPQIVSWNIDTEEELVKHVVSRNSDGIISNYPLELNEILKSRYPYCFG